MRRTPALLIALASLVLATPAQAGWFRSQALDGPAEIDALGDVDVARDGTGGVVYIKREGGVPQVFLSRLRRGAFQPPERITAGPPASEAAITAGDGGRLVIAWVAGGEVLGTLVPRGNARPVAPVLIGPGGGASGVAVDMGVNEAAYAIWSQNGDVRAARFVDAWTPVTTPLDIEPARPAGAGASRPRIAVSAEGNAIAVWGEEGADRRNHVYSRRLTAVTPSSFPQDLTLNDFEGQRAGGADSPDIDVEDDGAFAWAVFRQDVGGRSRSVARRLLGSTYEPPAPIDAGATSGSPRVDFNSRGLGASVAAAGDNAIFSSYLDVFDRFNQAVRVDRTPGAVPPGPVVATSERGDAYVAWRAGAPDGSGAVHTRRKNGGGGFEREFVASTPGFGAPFPGQLGIGSDASGNTAVAMIQGGPGASRLTVAVFDQPPGRPGTRSTTVPRPPKPLITWTRGSDRWGKQRFAVYVDGRRIGRTAKTRMRVKRRLRPGLHRFYIAAIDRRGQATRSLTRTFRVRP